MYAGHWAQWSGPVGLGFGVGATDADADGAGGGVGMFALPAALGAPDSPVPLQAARNAATPANAVPCRNRRRVRSGLRRWGCSAISFLLGCGALLRRRSWQPASPRRDRWNRRRPS